MSEQTQIIEEGSELLPEAPVAAKKGKGKAGAAIAAGVAAGVGAIAYDSYADDSEKKDETTPPSAPSGDQTSNAADSTATQEPADSVQAETHPAQDSTSAAQPGVMLIPDHLSIINAPDEMSFDEAFAWSREKAGAAQLFEWHGELYHTCHPNEYAALPAEMKTLFQDVWIDNEFGFLEVPGEGEMVSYDYVEEPAQDAVADQPVATDSTEINEHDAVVAEQDSVSMDGEEFDVVYSSDDFDNDFDGTDEWVNPEDIA